MFSYELQLEIKKIYTFYLCVRVYLSITERDKNVVRISMINS